MTCTLCGNILYRGELHEWSYTLNRAGQATVYYLGADDKPQMVCEGLTEEQAKALCRQHNLAFHDPAPLDDCGTWDDHKQLELFEQ